MARTVRRISIPCTFLALAVSAAAQPQPGPGRSQTQPQPPTVEEIKKRIPPGVRYLPDLAYREGNPAWRLDLAMPGERGQKPRPGVVFVHGGGWMGGDKRAGMWGELPLEYAQKGYVAISINYRLATEAPFPACVEDVKCAVRWLRAHAKDYNLDPGRIGGFGNSAGAHLTAMLALAGPQAGLEGDGPYQDQSSLLQAACISAPPLDFLNWERQTASPSRPSFGRLLAGPEETYAERAKRASPITHAHAGAPPLLVIQGSKDGTVPISQPDRFVKALREASAPDVTYLIFEGAGHGVMNTHAIYVRTAMAAFFDSKIGATASGKPFQARDPEEAGGLGGLKLEKGAKGPEGTESFSFTHKFSPDREPIRGILLKPVGKGPFPAVVVNHGGGGNAEGFGHRAGSIFAKAGYVAIACDLTHTVVKGVARDSPEFARFAGSRENAERILACVRILESLPYVDADKLGMFGNSMGAFATIGTCTRTDKIKVAAITAGGLRGPSRGGLDTEENAAKITAPFLIVHGRTDTVVKLELAQKLKEALERNKKIAELKIFEDAGHNVWREKQDEVFALIRAFFDKHLK